MSRKLLIAMSFIALNLGGYSAAAQANIWKVWLPGDRPIKSIAFVPAQSALIIGGENYIMRDQLSAPFGLGHAVRNESRKSGCGVFTHHGLLANGQLASLNAQGITLRAIPTEKQAFAELKPQSLYLRTTTLIGPSGEGIVIEPLALATNNSNSMFILGLDANDPDNKEADIKTYRVWELFKDNIDRWHATPLATSVGRTAPIIISTTRQSIVLLRHPSDPYSVSDAGKQRVEIRSFNPSSDANIKPFTLKDVTGAGIDQDGTILLSDPVNARVWRLSIDGETLTAVAGSSRVADERQTDPLSFKLNPGSIATAPYDGGFFVADQFDVYFVGPNDDFETELAAFVTEIEGLAEESRFCEAHDKMVRLLQLGREGYDMPRTRANLAILAISNRLGETGLDRVLNCPCKTIGIHQSGSKCVEESNGLTAQPVPFSTDEKSTTTVREEVVKPSFAKRLFAWCNSHVRPA